MAKNEKKEIRITNVNPDIVRQLKNIAKNLDTNIVDWLKPKIRQIVDNEPDHLKKDLY